MRSIRDSDSDVESRTGRRRILITQSAIDSPIRRSSRIKQSTKKYSPDSESDTSVSSNQPVRTTRRRTATMDSITTETLKGSRVRKPSISSEASETIDMDVGTPSKKTTRRSFSTATLSTPTRTSTRIASKRFIRAGSETKSSPPSSSRTTRRTRASSVDLETISAQSKNISSVSTKIHKRASVLPSQSPVKEEIEEKHESGNDSSVDKVTCSKGNQKVQEIDNTNKDKVEKDNSNDEMILALASDETSQQLADNKICNKHTATIVDEKSFDKIQSSCVEDSSDVEIEADDEIVIKDTNAKKNTKKDKSKVIENEECLTEIEESLITLCKQSSTKELTVRLENIFETSIGGQKKSPSNKENRTLNIIKDISAEKSVGPIITNVTSLNSKSSTPVLANKLSEKEIKFTRNESSLGKRRPSRESTETAAEYTTILKKNTDSIKEITDSSTNPLNTIVIHEKENLDSSSTDDRTKRQSLVHDADEKSTSTSDTAKPVSSLVNDVKLVEEIIDDRAFVETLSKTDENATEMANKLDKNITNTETCNKTIDDKESSCSLTANDNEMILELEESDASLDKNKSLNKSINIEAESNFDNSNNSIDVETCDDKSIIVNQLAPVPQDEAKDDLLDSTEQTKKNLSDHITKSTSESSNNILETINSSLNDLNADNATIQDTQSSDVMEVSEESTVDVSSKKTEFMNTSLKIITTSTQRENEDISATNVEEKSMELNQEDKKNMKDQEDSENTEIDDKSDVDVVSMFRDITADEWKEDAVEAKKTVENESEAECDLVLVDKRAWLAAENIKAVRDKECFEYDSDDTVLLKSQLDTTKANKKRLSTINEGLLINVDDDDEEEEEEGEKKAAKPIKIRKSLIKESALEKSEDSSTVCINLDSSNTVDKFLNKSKKDLNQNSSRSASRLNKSGQTTEESAEINESDDEIGDDANSLNRNLQTRKNISLRKSTEKRESLSKSSKDTPSRRSLSSTQNNSVNKSQADNSEEELDNIETRTEENLKKKKRSFSKSEELNKDADIDETESESKKNSSSKESDKESKDTLMNVKSSDENYEGTKNENLMYKKSGLNYSTLALAGSPSNNSNKSSDDMTDNISTRSLMDDEDRRLLLAAAEDIINKDISNLYKEYKEKSNTISFIISSDDDDDDDDDDDADGAGSTDSDIKREYNLDGEEQEHSDDSVPYDECRTSESESSDPDDTGSDLADFIVADDAIEDEKSEEEGRKEQNDEDDEQEEVEDKDVDDEVEDMKEENYSTHAGKVNEKSVRADTNVNKNNVSDKSFKVGKNKRKKTSEHTVTRQSKKKEDIKPKKSHTKKIEETNILDTSGSMLLIKKKRKSHVDETEQNLIKQLDESGINKRKLSKAARTLMECSTPKINSSKEKFTNDVEIAATALEALESLESLESLMEAADKQLNSVSETTQRKKKKSRKDSILKEDLSFKEPKHTNNKEKLLHTSLPSDLLERVGKARPMSKTIELNKTMNVTHTETPTIRDLRKEKLNESAPELKLKVEANQQQKRRLSKEKDNIAQKKTDEMESDEEVPNLIALFNDNIQEPSQRKQKKRKKQAEKTSNENITENVIPQDVIESDISQQQKKKKKKKKKSDDLSQALTVEDTICKNICQLVEKKKKKKKIDVTKTDKNTKENVQKENIHRKKKEPLHIVQDEAQHSKQKKKKKEKIVTNVEYDNIPPTENIIAKKKTKLQKIEDSKEILSKESIKKKKKKKEQEETKEKEKIPSLQTGASKSQSKSAKKTESKKSQLQNVFLSKTVESKNAAFIKARNEAMEAIKSATESIKLNKKLKKKREDNANAIQDQNAEVPIKRKKIEKYFEQQKQIVPSSTGGLKRLSDNVIDKLSDVPTRVKRRKLSQNTEQIMPSLSMKNPKFLETKMKNRNFIPLSSCGGTTQFAIVNMSKAKKQPSKTIVSLMSYKQRMLDRNNREPISSYLMYLQKQRAVQKFAKDGFSDNAF